MPLEVRRANGWGRIQTALGSETMSCELCAAVKGRNGKFGSLIVWALGRPLIRVCRPCAKEMQTVWAEAGGEA